MKDVFQNSIFEIKTKLKPTIENGEIFIRFINAKINNK
jgi:hypothetical protein